MNNGWIKLHRQLRDASFYGQPLAVALWVECLLRAAHEGKERFVGREKVKLESGQFIMGYGELGNRVGCARSTAKAWLDVFEKEGMVERLSNAKGTVVTIKNWIEYQEVERKKNAERTLSERQSYTNKNDKNERMKEDEGSDVSLRSPTPADHVRSFFNDEMVRQEVIRKIVDDGWDENLVRAEVKKFCSYWMERNKSGTRQKWEMERTFELKRRLNTWFNNSIRFSKPSYAR